MNSALCQEPRLKNKYLNKRYFYHPCHKQITRVLEPCVSNAGEAWRGRDHRFISIISHSTPCYVTMEPSLQMTIKNEVSGILLKFHWVINNYSVHHHNIWKGPPRLGYSDLQASIWSCQVLNTGIHGCTLSGICFNWARSQNYHLLSVSLEALVEYWIFHK